MARENIFDQPLAAANLFAQTNKGGRPPGSGWVKGDLLQPLLDQVSRRMHALIEANGCSDKDSARTQAVHEVVECLSRWLADPPEKRERVKLRKCLNDHIRRDPETWRARGRELWAIDLSRSPQELAERWAGWSDEERLDYQSLALGAVLAQPKPPPWSTPLESLPPLPFPPWRADGE